MEEHDEKLWELQIGICDDGDILLEQGVCGSCNEAVMVRLHRTQIPLVAEYGGFVNEEEVTKATERLQDRLNILISLIRAHCKPNEPLRIIVEDVLMGIGGQPIQSQLALPSV